MKILNYINYVLLDSYKNNK